MKALKNDNRYDDMDKVLDDVALREAYYKEYHIE